MEVVIVVILNTLEHNFFAAGGDSVPTAFNQIFDVVVFLLKHFVVVFLHLLPYEKSCFIVVPSIFNYFKRFCAQLLHKYRSI